MQRDYPKRELLESLNQFSSLSKIYIKRRTIKKKERKKENVKENEWQPTLTQKDKVQIRKNQHGPSQA